MKFRIHLIVFSFLMMFNLSAQADAYIGAEAGASWHSLNLDRSRDSLSALSGTKVSYKDDSTLASWRIFLGNRINDWLSVELGTFAGNDYKAKFSSSAVAINTKVDYQAADLSFLLHPLKDTTLDGLFFKIGVHYSRLVGDGRGTINGANAKSAFNDSGTGPLVGIGYQFKLSDQWKLRASYTYMDSFAGLSSENFDNFHVGLSYNF